MSKQLRAGVLRVSAAPKTHERVLALLRPRLSCGAVLDIPCGTGALSRALVAEGYQTFGADIAVRPTEPDMDYTRCDMTQRLPFELASFDAVLSVEGIEHIYDPATFVRECARVLRPNGLLLLSTPNISSLRSRWRWFLTGFHAKATYPPDETRSAPRDHVNMMSLPELRHLLHTSGFRMRQLATNRTKPISFLYAPAVPLQYAATRLAFRRKAKSAEHRRQMRELAHQMMSLPVLFGEILITVSVLENKPETD